MGLNRFYSYAGNLTKHIRFQEIVSFLPNIKPTFNQLKKKINKYTLLSSVIIESN